MPQDITISQESMQYMLDTQAKTLEALILALRRIQALEAKLTTKKGPHK
jgi:hypothetical protein